MERKLVEVAYEITYNCNLRCSHCYNKEKVKSPSAEMTTGQIFKVLKELKDFGVDKLKIGGGEPLLRQDFFDVYNYASSLGFEVNFSTNGLLVLDNMESIVKNNISKIQISLDNIEEKHDIIRNYKDLFQIVSDAVKELNNQSIKINVATVLTKDNHNDLESLLGFCKNNDIFRWKIMKYIPKSCIDDLLLSSKEYKKAVTQLLNYKNICDNSPEIIVAREFDLIRTPMDYNDMQCFGGKSFLSLKPNGDITPCSYIYDIICGNLVDENINEVWNNKKMINFSKDYLDNSCMFVEKCKGGCKAVSYFINDKLACDPYCWVKEK